MNIELIGGGTRVNMQEIEGRKQARKAYIIELYRI
jgi:hypothetical protein